MTKIQWTERTWNPIVGCNIVSPGCTNCYAMKTAWRMGHNPKTPQYHGLTKKVNGNAVWTGKMNLAEKALRQPLKRKKPTMYFVNSMGDLFHEAVPDEWTDRVFAVMALCPQHTFQVLTKRPERMREYMAGSRMCPDGVRRFSDWWIADTPPLFDPFFFDGQDWPLPNVWLGVSVENQATADERIPQLLDTPAALRFISAEPLLGNVDLREIWTHCPTHDFAGGCFIGQCADRRGIDWVICGGESGPKARPIHPDWARSLRDQCAESGVPFWFKQWGPKGSGNTLDGKTYELMAEAME